MAENKLKTRDQIDSRFKWNIEAIYENIELCEKDLEKALKLSQDLLKYQGKVAESADTLLEVLKLSDEVEATFENAFIYVHMSKDQDNKVPEYVELFGKAMGILSQISTNTSFLTPELLSNDAEKIYGFIEENDDLKLYRFHLENILRSKAHVLSKEEEAILASFTEVFGGPDEIYTMLTDAEFSFGEIENEDGEKVQVTHGNYISLLMSHDRNVRKAAFEALYSKYKEYINTISTIYATSVKTDVVKAKVRKYPSARAAALDDGNIPESVYDNLVQTVHEYLPVMYKYVNLRKKLLGVDDLMMYDCYVPLVQLPKKEYAFDEAFDTAKEGLKVLGEQYQKDFERARQERWIDIYENEGKTSGAYSTGGYKTNPYILLNYDGSLGNVFTLAHEMGHSLNSLYTNQTQPFPYHGYSIFTAEVCSTVNEALLMKHMLKNEKDPEVRKYLVNNYIEDFRTTLFRQTMFAEFEHWAHTVVENGGALTADSLCEKYNELNSLYFGPEMNDAEFIKYEWARIPHFYRAFYVYQYATGYSAATAISKKILEEGETARDNYLKFLGAGYSDYPVETLKIAGVDMSSPEPVRLAMETFKNLVEEFEKLV
ncbi:MAG: oligoendopeptidase F [Clostridia bacterium]|nr:oligoendopeptidase F [Clostridia bacterium]